MRRFALLALVLFAAGCVDAKPSTPSAADLEAITIVNDGTEVHTFTAEGQRFDTGTLEPGDDTTLVLTEPGEVVYWDAEAPDQTATLTVVPAR